ncbi:MAG: ABC transporter permease, partial [Corynebacterium matruchotii]
TNQGIVYAGWNPDWFKFFLGAMLLFAVLVNSSFGKITTGRQE